LEAGRLLERTSGNGLGLVTTHDLELTDLDKTVPQLTNAHF
jgi:DNA mismatch repair ATPase MutS